MPVSIGGSGFITGLDQGIDGVGIITTSQLNVGTGGTVITTTAGGLVGIGTTNPTSKIDIRGNTTSDIAADLQLTRTGTLNTSVGQGAAIQFNNSTSGKITLIQGAEDNFQVYNYAPGGSWTERLRVDSSGRVTTPYQISFLQRFMSGSEFNSGTLNGGTGDHNIGSHYDSSTGIFTAPIAGYYVFGCGILVETGTGRLEGAITKNNNIDLVAFNGTGTTYDGPTATCVAYLAANDNVRVKRTSGTAYATNHPNHYFWGRLVG